MQDPMIEQAQGWLKELFAPWVRALGLKPVRIAGGEAELLLPFDPALCRVGGTICGQALMAAAIVLCIGVLVVRKRTELAWQAAGALAVVMLLASVM